MAPDVDPAGLSEAVDAATKAAEDFTKKAAAINADLAAQAVSDATVGSLNTAADVLESTAQTVGLDTTGLTAAADAGINTLEDVSDAAIGTATADSAVALGDSASALGSALDNLEGAAGGGGGESAGDLIASISVENVPSDIGASLSLGEAAPVTDVGGISLDALGSTDVGNAAGDALDSTAEEAGGSGIGLGDVAGALGYIQAADEIAHGAYTEAAGELAGSAIGDAVAGPIGGMVGGFVGQEVGTVLDDVGVNDAISAVANDVGQAAGAAAVAVGDAASSAVDAVGGVASNAGDAVESAASDVGDAASEVADDIGDLF